MTCKCGNEFSKERFDLGYDTCLDCGDCEAQKEIAKKRKQIAVAYNKGPIMYITPKADLTSIGRKV